MKLSKIFSLTAAAALTLCAFSGCSERTEKSDPQTEPTVAASQLSDSDSELFRKYISNTYISTGNNMYLDNADGVTYRAYLPAEAFGEYEYRFYFSNTVDSTYDSGDRAFVGRSGGTYTISDAFIADGGTDVKEEITNRTPVTFGGNTEKTVTPDESYWSDPVDFTLAEGHYIVWEWTVTGSGIPCTNMSYLTSATADSGNGKFELSDEIPLPQLIGCDRKVNHYITAIGDSITQGCQTTFMAYEYWAAQISKKLGSDYGFYNCGLGWSRASDAAVSENWVKRASAGDTVIVAFGTNDISSGKYGGEGGDHAVEIEASLRTVTDKLTDSGCGVILFNSPPQNYTGSLETTRVELNRLLQMSAQEKGIRFFDFAGLLCPVDEPSRALYGAHPDGEGGNIVSDAFIEKFFKT